MKRTIIAIAFLYAYSAMPQSFTQVTAGDIVNDGGWNYACCWADFNNDGFDDLFVCNNDADNGKLNFLYFNNSDGTFEKDTSGGPVTTDGGSSYGCCAADYDNDGDNDLFVSNYNENNFLYRNTGNGEFEKITAGVVVNNSGKSTGCEWIDYDKDGWLDLFVCNRNEPNFLYHNEGDGAFTKVFTGLLTSENKNTGGCARADFDGNGFPDVYLANSGPDYNSLFFNNGDGTFTQLTGDPAVSDLESFDFASCGDIDNDGDMDIYTAPGMLPASSYDLYLYTNNGDGSFVRVSGLPHSGINSGGGSSMMDYDNDGDLDIFHSAYDGKNIVLENDGEGNFSQVITGVLANDGNYNKEPSWTDYDMDGDIDLFIAVNNYFSGNNKLFSNNGNQNNWLYIDLAGSVSNRNGIGSLIVVQTEISGNTVVQTREVTGLNSLRTHFGLGEAETVDEITVFWPSGTEQTLTSVGANQIIMISESTVAAGEGVRLPDNFLGQNFPNPFSASTDIPYHIFQGKKTGVYIEIFDAFGRLVRHLPCDGTKPVVTWDAKKNNGSAVEPGVYYYRLVFNGMPVKTKSCILL
ncbi:MAG: VCBS repeat-containing protein [Bacteroidales bacterium]|nr:VCBS repeat-containing protein [Bacteroidales bacterium]